MEGLKQHPEPVNISSSDSSSDDDSPRKTKRVCPNTENLQPTSELSPNADNVAPTPDLSPMVDAVAPTPDLSPMVDAVAPTPDLSSMVDAVAPTPDLSPKVDGAEPTLDLSPEEALLRKAQLYQEYMKSIPLPTQRGSVILFKSWTGLGMSMKALYKQPFHYLTNIHFRQLDKVRIGSEDEETPLDFIIHPVKAEASIWLMEEFHRKIASPHHLAKLWLSDPLYHMYIDPVLPEPAGSSAVVVVP